MTDITAPAKRVLSGRQTAKKASITERTLQRLNKAGTGPRRLKLSDRRIGYLESDVDEWLESLREPVPQRTAEADVAQRREAALTKPREASRRQQAEDQSRQRAEATA